MIGARAHGSVTGYGGPVQSELYRSHREPRFKTSKAIATSQVISTHAPTRVPSICLAMIDNYLSPRDDSPLLMPEVSKASFLVDNDAHILQRVDDDVVPCPPNESIYPL